MQTTNSTRYLNTLRRNGVRNYIMVHNYNFDEIIDRSNTGSLKYDLREQIFGQHNIIPMWVADMDFKTPDFIAKALRKRTSHELFGYTVIPDGLYESIIQWIYQQHQWKVERDWIGLTPGVVPALNLAVLAFTNPGDKIIIQTPVYSPFYTAVTDHNRQLITNPLKLSNGRYYMDFDHLYSQLDHKTKMLILCSPHNPTGNVWKKAELLKLIEICLEKKILIVSDEIHSDIVFKGNKHLPLASLSDEIAQNVVTLMAASKTFNFAGLSTSYFIAPNKTLFNQLQNLTEKLHLNMCNIFGIIATEEAYRNGRDWLDQLILYLESNIGFAKEFINNHIPGVKVIVPEATFLLWTDFRETGIEPSEMNKLLVKKARLGLSNGLIFGCDGSGFQRINIGCPRSTLEQALTQIQKVLKF